eukprot:2572782-Amphidinium_carterae.1
MCKEMRLFISRHRFGSGRFFLPSRCLAHDAPRATPSIATTWKTGQSYTTPNCGRWELNFHDAPSVTERKRVLK